MLKSVDLQEKYLSWGIAVPLITNRLIIGATAKIFGLAILLVGGSISLVFFTQGDFEIIPKVLLLLLILGSILFLSGLILMVVIFQNRWQYRYIITDEGIVCETIDKKLKAVNRLAVGVGMLLGSPQAVGAGLIGQGQEVQQIKWQGRFLAEYLPASCVIIFRNAWRRLMIIYCSPENYDEVANLVKTQMEQHGSERRMPQKSILSRYLGYSAAIVISAIPLFFLVDPFQVPLWMPMVLLGFSLATLWLVGVFGYAVFAAALLIPAAVAINALTRVDSYLHPGEHFARWTIYSGDDWSLIFFGAAGLCILCGFALKGIKGKIISMLSSDMSDMGG